jgi:hypothetical protein
VVSQRQDIAFKGENPRSLTPGKTAPSGSGSIQGLKSHVRLLEGMRDPALPPDNGHRCGRSEPPRVSSEGSSLEFVPPG